MVKSKNPWKRRFGVVLLINFTKNKKLKKEIKEIIKPLENDKEHYVKKAKIGLKENLSSSSQVWLYFQTHLATLKEIYKKILGVMKK